MNYIKQYFRIIRFRRDNPIVKSQDAMGAVHYHHIIPKACGGKDSPKSTVNQQGSNLIGVTPREHYVLHELLMRIYKGTPYEYAMCCAWRQMSNSGVKSYGVKQNSRIYEANCIRHSQAMSKERKGHFTFKMSEKGKANCKKAANRPEVRRKKSEAMKKLNLSEKHKLIWQNPERHEKATRAFKGRIITKSHRESLRKAMIGKHPTEEARKKMSNPRSKEGKQNIRLAILQHHLKRDLMKILWHMII